MQGGTVIVTNDYLTRMANNFSEDDVETQVMMFQLLGIPNMNQKAREVPPFRKSLASSGLYLMLAKSRLYFWIGLDYYNNYLNEKTFN